ncbi:hypothetical protein M601_000480 [Cellulophaga baltica 4]|nr:hypothetical protein M601_000480 [Cellulophaga baltica 4]
MQFLALLKRKKQGIINAIPKVIVNLRVLSTDQPALILFLASRPPNIAPIIAPTYGTQAENAICFTSIPKTSDK